MHERQIKMRSAVKECVRAVPIYVIVTADRCGIGTRRRRAPSSGALHRRRHARRHPIRHRHRGNLHRRRSRRCCEIRRRHRERNCQCCGSILRSRDRRGNCPRRPNLDMRNLRNCDPCHSTPARRKAGALRGMTGKHLQNEPYHSNAAPARTKPSYLPDLSEVIGQAMCCCLPSPCRSDRTPHRDPRRG